MSKVNIEFDTETKLLTVSMDGAVIENVRDICFYNEGYYDQPSEKFSMGIAQVKKNDNGTRTWINTSAEISVEQLTAPKPSMAEVISQIFSKK